MSEIEIASDIKNKFRDFIEKDFTFGTYMSLIEKMVNEKKTRLIINLNDFREFDKNIAEQLLKEPSDYIVAFEAQLSETIKKIDPNAESNCSVGFSGNFGKYYVTPRYLLSNLLGRLVAVEGIVTKSSFVLPKVVQTVHYCPKKNEFLKKEYRDSTSLSGQPTGYSYPKKDGEGNLLETEYGLSRYKDTQTLFIQEMPERAPAGQLPRSVECLIEDDLVDYVKPGDRIRIMGVYRAMGGVESKNGSSGVMRTVLIANNIQIIGSQFKDLEMTPEDVSKIRELSKKKNIFEALSKSIAPSIYGHETIKKAILLQMLGGVEKIVSNSHLRGDINLLLVGDPSTAKSQLLRFVMNLAPLVISTTGRASTGVGLTAAVVQDQQTGSRTLQAGAMVLADGGIVCIDEFDKMCDADRVAMHEVMEQQTVTIAKAGIHTTLNARCSVIAAANPMFGQYNGEISVQRNIGIPDSLLSRFDLVFIVLDKKESTIDREIAEHVLNIHMYKGKNETTQSKSLISQELEEPELENELFSIFKDQKIFSMGFLRKYINYMKYRVKPVLTQSASDLISELYCDLRKSSTNRTLSITPRTLETIIRLSTAHAKCRMSQQVTDEDVKVIFKIMEQALYFSSGNKKEEKKEENKRKRDETENNSPNKKVVEEKLDEGDLKNQLIKIVKETRSDAISLEELMKQIISLNSTYKKDELKKMILKIVDSDPNQFMVDDDVLYIL